MENTKGYFEFKAEVYFDGKRLIEKGVTYASDFSEAMALVEDYYGLELCTISMTAIEPYGVYILEGDTKIESNFFERGE